MKVSGISYLLDDGPLIGFLDGDGEWHEWSMQALAVFYEPLATTETAVAEACHRLRKLRSALVIIPRLIAEGRLLLVPVLAAQPSRVEELLTQYPLMDTGDATLVVLSELCPRARPITVDDDFLYYRRVQNQPLPLVIPERA